MERGECDIIVDGGGSGTRLGIAVEGATVLRQSGPTCNAVSRGSGSAGELIAAMLTKLWNDRPAAITRVRSTILAVSNASTPRALHDLATSVAAAAAGCEPLRAARCWIMNDIVPLVVGSDSDVVAIAGTGTGFAALSPSGAWARASGLEYLLTDEGGGFDIGLQGLRAVIRAHDGRGPATTLTLALSAWGPASVDDLYHLVYGNPAPKMLIATFAPQVCTAADSGDEVAQEIIARAAAEVATGVAAVCSKSGLDSSQPLRCALGGSLLTDATALHRSFVTVVTERFPQWRLERLPTESLQPIARLAVRLAESPDHLSRVPLACDLRTVLAQCC